MIEWIRRNLSEMFYMQSCRALMFGNERKAALARAKSEYYKIGN